MNGAPIVAYAVVFASCATCLGIEAMHGALLSDARNNVSVSSLAPRPVGMTLNSKDKHLKAAALVDAVQIAASDDHYVTAVQGVARNAAKLGPTNLRIKNKRHLRNDQALKLTKEVRLATITRKKATASLKRANWLRDKALDAKRRAAELSREKANTSRDASTRSLLIASRRVRKTCQAAKEATAHAQSAAQAERRVRLAWSNAMKSMRKADMHKLHAWRIGQPEHSSFQAQSYDLQRRQPRREHYFREKSPPMSGILSASETPAQRVEGDKQAQTKHRISYDADSLAPLKRLPGPAATLKMAMATTAADTVAARPQHQGSSRQEHRRLGTAAELLRFQSAQFEEVSGRAPRMATASNFGKLCSNSSHSGNRSNCSNEVGGRRTGSIGSNITSRRNIKRTDNRVNTASSDWLRDWIQRLRGR